MHIIMADSGIGGLFSALGLNWESFLLNMAAFLVTAYVIGKYIYPPLSKALDAKKDELEAAVRLEKEAGGKLDEAKLEAAQIVRRARGEADEILAMTRDQANTQLDEAKTKAQAAADRTVADARDQLARDVRIARDELRADTAKLVAGATEAVIGEKLTSKEDNALVTKSLGGQKT
jgi:F-type H+-transporting ATPase subunit b